MEAVSHVWEELCTGCLSTGRHMTILTGAAAEFFNEIVIAAGGLQGGTVCWECKARVHCALKFRALVTTAVHSLTSCQLNKLTCSSSLSRLSCHTANNVIYATHGTDVDVASGEPEHSPLFVKMEDDLDSYMDDALQYHVEDDKEILKSDPNYKQNRKKKKTKKTENGKKDEFDESDEEPLASKLGPSGHGDGTKSKKRGRGRKEGASGVVRNARVVAKLARLGLAAGDLDMVVLSWDEVEAERQRALSSESYLRHEHRCELCAAGFNHRLKLERHMEKHRISAGEYECNVCRVRCRAPHALAAHKRRHRVRWRCGECGALWSRAAVAADHLRRHHASLDGAGAGISVAHTCPTCQHKAPTLNKLRAHMRCHAARQTCAECGKEFPDRNALRTHLFSHRADKEHACDRCPARFLYPRALRLHRLTHDPPPPFYCHQCDVTFKNPMSYYQHMKYSLKHVHPDKLKHMCAACPARFVRAARLADHVAARHTRRTPHRCDVDGCNYSCASRSVLRAHARAAHVPPGTQRTRPRRLVCHACGHTYTTKKSLERHLRTHSNSGLPSRAEQSKRTHSPITDVSVTDGRFYVEPTADTNVQKEA